MPAGAQRTAGQAQDEGERQRASSHAQPQLGPGRVEKHPAGSARRHQADQDRDPARRPQLHLGFDRNSADGRPALSHWDSAACREWIWKPPDIRRFIRGLELRVTRSRRLGSHDSHRAELLSDSRPRS